MGGVGTADRPGNTLDHSISPVIPAFHGWYHDRSIFTGDVVAMGTMGTESWGRKRRLAPLSLESGRT
ncbi:MAG: hypothetical protein ACLU8D_06185 [Enterocloster sp.]